jgi:hypothetical protein
MSSARSVEYHVELSSRAEFDLASTYTEINAEHSDASYRWYNGLEVAVMSLTTLPNRGISSDLFDQSKLPYCRHPSHSSRRATRIRPKAD